MEVIINGEPNEIAALVLAVQGRQEDKNAVDCGSTSSGQEAKFACEKFNAAR